MKTQRHLISTGADQVTLEYCGATYKILKDIRTDVGTPHPPSWFVQRMTDLRTSKRYYSRPEGAITALLTGSIVWVS